jgi:hypothetical protein
MGKAIFRVDDNGKERFLVWSSTVDAPITFACTAEEVTKMFVEEAREDATRMVQDMIERTLATGSSSRMGYNTLADVAGANRAGPNESTLTEDEIVEFYVRRKKNPTKVALAVYRKGKK